MFLLSFLIKRITRAMILSVLFKVLYLVISMTFNRLVFPCVLVILVIIDFVSIVDSVSWISPMVFDGHSCRGLKSQDGPWFKSLWLEIKALVPTPLVMMSAGFDEVSTHWVG